MPADIPAGGSVAIPNQVRPEIAPGQATEALTHGADEVGSMAAELGAHFMHLRRLTDFNDGMADWSDAADDIVDKARMDPDLRSNPNLMHQTVNDQLNDLSNNLIQQHQLGNSFHQLERNFAHMTAAKSRMAWQTSVSSMETDTVDELKAQNLKVANIVANQQDQKQGAMLLNNQFQTIDAFVHSGVYSQGQADLMKGELQQKVDINTGMRIASQGGDVDSYFSSHPNLPPESVTAMTNAATTAIKRPMIEIDAQRQNTRAQLLQQFDKNPDPSQIQAAWDRRDINSDDFAHYMHYAPMPMGNPDAVKQMQDNVTNALTEQDLDGLTEQVDSPQGIEMYGKNGAMIHASIEAARRDMGHGANAAYQEGANEIQDAFDHLDHGDEYSTFVSMKHGAVPTIQQLRERALGDLKVAKAGGVVDLQKIRELTKQAIQANQPDLASMRTGISTLPKRNPGEAPGDYIRRIRSAPTTLPAGGGAPAMRVEAAPEDEGPEVPVTVGGKPAPTEVGVAP